MTNIQNYLKNLEQVLKTSFGNDVIPIALKKDKKEPMYAHKTKSNEELWKCWNDVGCPKVAISKADMGFVIRNRAMVVIDFDDKEQARIFEEYIPEFATTVKQSTKKGYHYFFKASTQTKEMKLSNTVRPFGEGKDIDIITTWEKGTGGIITVYPSANKEWVHSILDKDMHELPSRFIDFYNDHLPKKQSNVTTTTEKQPTNNDKQTIKNDVMSFEVLNKVLGGLSQHRSDKFDYWHVVVWAIYNVCAENNVSSSKRDTLIHNFSSRAQKYDIDEVDKFICENTSYYKDGYNIGTILQYLKEDNFDLFVELFGFEDDYKKDKDIFEQTHFKVVKPPCYCTIKEDGKIEMQSRKDFQASYEHKQTTKNGKSGSFTDFWFKDPEIRLYEYIDFLPPPLTCPPTTFNMWCGFAIENIDVQSSENIEPVLNHIDILVNHDLKARDYFLKWLAHIIQYPGSLNGIAVVFKSAQGSGKNIFLEFLHKILGKDLYYETANPSQDLWSRFALGRKNKVLINIDETSGKDTFPFSEQLKNMITSPNYNYEQKGVNPITLVNLSRLIFTTNNHNPVKVEGGDRRYVILQCSDEKKGNKKYFDDLWTYFNHLSNQKAFFDYLKNLDISNVDWINDRPITEIYQEIQESNAPIHIKFFKHLSEENEDQTTLKYSGMGLFEHFNKFLEEGKYSGYTMNNTAWGRLIKPLIKAKEDDDCCKAFIVKSMSKGCVVYKVLIADLRKWLVANKHLPKCLIEDVDE